MCRCGLDWRGLMLAGSNHQGRAKLSLLTPRDSICHRHDVTTRLDVVSPESTQRNPLFRREDDGRVHYGQWRGGGSGGSVRCACPIRVRSGYFDREGRNGMGAAILIQVCGS